MLSALGIISRTRLCHHSRIQTITGLTVIMSSTRRSTRLASQAQSEVISTAGTTTVSRRKAVVSAKVSTSVRPSTQHDVGEGGSLQEPGTNGRAASVSSTSALTELDSEEEVLATVAAVPDEPDQPPKRKRRKLNREEMNEKDDEHYDDGAVKRGKGTRKARKKKATGPDPTQFLPRDRDNPWKIGAHVSASGGVENAVVNAAMIGANAFALFLKSQRKWTSPPITPESISLFKERMKEYGYDSKVVLPHGNYLVNLGNPDTEKREKSFECFLDDLKRCEALGLELYNFHPGSTVGEASVQESLTFIAECINRAHKETSSVVIVLENMAGAGNVLGSEFSQLGEIIRQVEDKTRVGVCMDTCHAFAAGYDIRSLDGWNATMKEFDDKIGLKYLRGMHINDSKADLNTKKDRHENIGLGHLGLGTFQHILRDPRTMGIPLILETPSFEQPQEVWGSEIGVLQRVSKIEELPEERTTKAETETVLSQETLATTAATADGTTVTKEEMESGDIVKDIKVPGGDPGGPLETFVQELRDAVQGAQKLRDEKEAVKSEKRKARGVKGREGVQEDEGEEDEDVNEDSGKRKGKGSAKAETKTRKARSGGSTEKAKSGIEGADAEDSAPRKAPKRKRKESRGKGSAQNLDDDEGDLEDSD
ncbi:hypothetical protein D9613_012513 [Agrocybe pediades]|uniref:Apurinic-apyrimidinic endonuclease 1 n=1 Tax=Agrocybe pediades TaxID=84607 RepID=A0A8H4VMS7_9AGAR|nr:hypothetical protein D9613_012513 [Agrocybe pediades]